MNLTVRPLRHEDYDDTLVGWWQDWEWTPPPRDFLPDDGASGFMVEDDGDPVCAGYYYLTNSKVIVFEWVISDKNYKDRKEPLKLLMSTIDILAKNMEAKYLITYINNKSLIDLYEKNGWVHGDKYANEMIKRLA